MWHCPTRDSNTNGKEQRQHPEISLVENEEEDSPQKVSEWHYNSDTKANGNQRGVKDTLWRMQSEIQGLHCDFFLLPFVLFFFTLYPVTSPGSQTAAETSFTSRSCTSPMLSPMFSKPSWRTLMEGTSTFTSKPRTLPKLRRNCTTMRQSENVLPSRTRPGMRGNSGKGW